MATQAHETLTSFRRVQESSSRKFGVTVGLILAAIALWPAVRHGLSPRIWLLVVGLALVVCGLVAPRLLDPLNRAWFKLGLLLTKITNPIVMGLMFFVAVVPIAWLVRLRGKDLLRLRRDPGAETYWIDRTGPASGLTNQF